MPRRGGRTATESECNVRRGWVEGKSVKATLLKMYDARRKQLTALSRFRESVECRDDDFRLVF